jgi:D-3-phosphoglycerate dehydrogenase
VSINCDLNPTSHHLIGARELKIMKPSAVLINTSRGSVVDEPALADALKSGEIAGAGLDVFEVEPLPADSPLRKMDTVMLCPHLANSSPRACRDVHHRVIRNVQELLAQCETAVATGEGR